MKYLYELSFDEGDHMVFDLRKLVHTKKVDNWITLNFDNGDSFKFTVTGNEDIFKDIVNAWNEIASK